MKIQKITFQQIGDDRGWLSVAEYGKQIPFLVKRIYYIYGVKDGKRRGYHAHKNLQQIMFCISGSCKVMFTDGLERTDILLDKPYEAVYIKECVWREMYEFSDNAVLLVLASENYDEGDYIRDYNAFLEYKKSELVR